MKRKTVRLEMKKPCECGLLPDLVGYQFEKTIRAEHGVCGKQYEIPYERRDGQIILQDERFRLI